jgi:catechol 2,3-dioxygenase-like lactoylglutathione lyase family enzyme
MFSIENTAGHGLVKGHCIPLRRRVHWELPGLDGPERRSWRWAMAIRLDHTIVPAVDKRASARFFAEIFGLAVRPGRGYFAQVQVNDSLTLDFEDEADPIQGHHYAFHVGEAEFEAIFGRVRTKGVPYGSEPDSPANGRINTRRGGRGFYFEDPSGHLLEVMTVPETGT